MLDCIDGAGGVGKPAPYIATVFAREIDGELSSDD